MITSSASLPLNDVRIILQRWRTRTLASILIAVSLLVLPAVAATLFRLAQFGESFWAGVLLGLYALLLGLTFHSSVDFRLRGYAVLLLGDAAGIFALVVGGPTSDGRLFLLVMPLFAFILIDVHPGWIAVGASLLIYLLFSFLSNTGLLGGALLDWIARVGNPFVPGFSMMTWATLAALLLSTVILLDRFYRLLLDALKAERRASTELAHSYETTLSVASELRHKLARDLHDGPAQRIAALAMQLDYVSNLLARDPEKAKRELEGVRAAAV